MNLLNIKKVGSANVAAQEIPALFGKNDIVYNKVENVNWPAEFPYCPKMEFGVAYTDDAILVHYRVEEQSVRAVAQRLASVRAGTTVNWLSWRLRSLLTDGRPWAVHLLIPVKGL